LTDFSVRSSIGKINAILQKTQLIAHGVFLAIHPVHSEISAWLTPATEFIAELYAFQANSCPQGATHRAAVVTAADSLNDGFTYKPICGGARLSGNRPRLAEAAFSSR